MWWNFRPGGFGHFRGFGRFGPYPPFWGPGPRFFGPRRWFW